MLQLERLRYVEYQDLKLEISKNQRGTFACYKSTTLLMLNLKAHFHDNLANGEIPSKVLSSMRR